VYLIKFVVAEAQEGLPPAPLCCVFRLEANCGKSMDNGILSFLIGTMGCLFATAHFGSCPREIELRQKCGLALDSAYLHIRLTNDIIH